MPESPVKVEKLLELIHKQKNRFRLSPDGRLSFAPKQQQWDELVAEVSQLLRDLYDREPPRSQILCNRCRHDMLRGIFQAIPAVK